MAIRRAILWGILAASAPVRAALYEGKVVESEFGMGVDSVRISLLGGSGSGFSDSAGRFTFSPAPTSLRPAYAFPEVAWRADSRTIAWSGSPGTVAIAIRDVSGRTVLACNSTSPRGGYRVEGLAPGFHFASMRIMGEAWSWRWFEGGGPHPGAQPALRDSREAAAGKASAAKAFPTDTLLFEKGGFAAFKLPVTGAASDLAVRLARHPIKVLIVDGMSNHDWRQTTRIARAIYAKAGFFSVEVSTAPDRADAAAWQAWRPRFGEYEVVLLNYNSGHGSGSLRWPREREIELEEFVRSGGGLYALHAANNAFSQWPEYNRMIGTGWRSSGFGFALEVDASGRIVRIPPGTGGETSHGNRADVPLRLLGAHPIHRGYPRTFQVSSLEIYQYARGPAENCEVLSYAFDGASSGGSGRNWPVELMVAYGEGRVYNSTLGHVWAGETLPNAARDMAFQTALIRATEWLARREVFFPVPAEFNTAARIAYGDLSLP